MGRFEYFSHDSAHSKLKGYKYLIKAKVVAFLLNILNS